MDETLEAAFPNHCAWHHVVVVVIGRPNVRHQFSGLVKCCK